MRVICSLAKWFVLGAALCWLCIGRQAALVCYSLNSRVELHFHGFCFHFIGVVVSAFDGNPSFPSPLPTPLRLRFHQSVKELRRKDRLKEFLYRQHYPAIPLYRLRIDQISQLGERGESRLDCLPLRPPALFFEFNLLSMPLVCSFDC